MRHNPIGSQILMRAPAQIFPQKLVCQGNNPYCPYYPEAETMAIKSLKICLAITTILFIIVATVIVTLILTMFKPKNPEISIHPIDLKNFQLLSPNSTSEPLGMVITIVNPNYGSFEYVNSTGYLKYHDTVIAEVPLETRLVPARSTTNVSASAAIMTRKLIDDRNFLQDVEVGAFNLTSKATLAGKVTVIKILRRKAKVYITCHISFNIISVDFVSTCMSKIKL